MNLDKRKGQDMKFKQVFEKNTVHPKCFKCSTTSEILYKYLRNVPRNHVDPTVEYHQDNDSFI